MEGDSIAARNSSSSSCGGNNYNNNIVNLERKSCKIAFVVDNIGTAAAVRMKKDREMSKETES